MLHPLFGCRHTDRIVETSLYTKCRELLPASTSPPNPSTEPSRTRTSTLHTINNYFHESQDLAWTSGFGSGAAINYEDEWSGYDDYMDDWYDDGVDDWQQEVVQPTYTEQRPIQRVRASRAAGDGTDGSSGSMRLCYHGAKMVNGEWTLAQLVDRVRRVAR